MTVTTKSGRVLPTLDDVLGNYLSDPDKRREFDRGMDALRFGVQVAFRCEELGLTPEQVEALSGIPPASLLRIQTRELPDTLTQMRLARVLRARIIVEPSGQWTLETVGQLAQAA